MLGLWAFSTLNKLPIKHRIPAPGSLRLSSATYFQNTNLPATSKSVSPTYLRIQKGQHLPLLCYVHPGPASVLKRRYQRLGWHQVYPVMVAMKFKPPPQEKGRAEKTPWDFMKWLHLSLHRQTGNDRYLWVYKTNLEIAIKYLEQGRERKLSG